VHPSTTMVGRRRRRERYPKMGVDELLYLER
jgi:hypothetical protein